MEQTDIKIERSLGRTKTGIPVFFVRPAHACENRSRCFVGYDKMNKGIVRWYASSILYFIVDGHLIGSNNEKNALSEYWRICDRNKVGKIVEVKLLDNGTVCSQSIPTQPLK